MEDMQDIFESALCLETTLEIRQEIMTESGELDSMDGVLGFCE